ncbi:Teichoic acid export ATP-binding protein TagH [Dissulfuribacter thermophilus]|uniref:Teichoic acid export ATP-binding protein TagH n=1 Tax=Dissulfuribacter thermophilus TaxID=1156395 RepID=A0A1B9F363_9BACT|nr:ABC transporter ATP-binding protein [Dissulfuribacter thermophilus]OCC14274.1 Teichoic acid export ATP-binding protein TagH [Dissulfuribacter thermophilus]
MLSVDVRGLTKIFRVYESPSQRLKEILFRKKLHKEFIALKGISFSMASGDVLGLFGDNGAGKSTLLKILAGALEPTSGTIKVNGRVTALLELGAGFHPEFTGRQNIYLNAALFGMTEEEIRAKEQDIIEFSELGDFIDQPVKIYSSGMYVRLAFSIATSVDPDILIVDEALSVGDQHFQKKCIERMMKFCEQNKTILFCSHSIYHLEQLCKTGIWLHRGEIRMKGPIKETLSAYQDYVREIEGANRDATQAVAQGKCPSTADLIVFIKDIWIEDLKGRRCSSVETGQHVILKMKIGAIKRGVKGHVGFGIIRNDETLMFGTTTHIDGIEEQPLEDGSEFSIEVPNFHLLPGTFKVLGLLTDESGLHPYHMARSESFKVRTEIGYYGVTVMEHKWQF